MSKRFWLMARPCYTQSFRYCKQCNELNYMRGNKRFMYDEDEELVHVTITMCKECTMANIEINNVAYNYIKR